MQMTAVKLFPKTEKAHAPRSAEVPCPKKNAEGYGMNWNWDSGPTNTMRKKKAETV